MRWAFAVMVAVLAFAAVGTAQDDERIRIGVIDLTSETVPPSHLRLLADRLRVELFATGRFRVLERDEMDAILEEQAFQQSGCVATECVVEMGQLLGVEQMVGGSVGKLGEMYTLSLRMIDVRTGAIVRTAVRDCQCSLEEILVRVIGETARALAGVTAGGAVQAAGEGIVFVASEPSGARIFLDGQPRDETTPATLSEVPAGMHIVRVTSDSLVAEEQITVVRDEVVRVNLDLQPITGSLFIDSDPPQAEVYLGTAKLGVTPYLVKNLRPGEYVVTLARRDRMWREKVEIEGDERTTVFGELVPRGFVRTRITPSQARVTFDGMEADYLQGRYVVMSGERVIRAQLEDYEPFEETISVPPGETMTVDHTMDYLFGRLTIESDPEGAQVSSEPDVMQGIAPLYGSHIEPGTYHIRMTLPERVPYEETVEVEEGGSYRVTGTLPWRPEVAARRRATIKAGFRWTSLALGLAAGALAAKYELDARSAHDDREEAYRLYREAYTTEDVLRHRTDMDAAAVRVDDASKKRNILYGVSGGLFALGITLWVW